MSFTFDETLPTDRDYVRLRLDDVDENDHRLTDELIDTLLNKYGLGGALLEGCNRIRLFYSKEPDTIGLTMGRRFSWRDRFNAYNRLYDELLEEFGSAAGADNGVQVDVLPLRCEDEKYFLPYNNWPCDLRIGG